MNLPTDQQLLADYAGSHSEAAFTELVRRHIDHVHSAAWRMTGETHSAQDITQAVFVALAENAARLAGHPVLSGWLHTTARNLAAKHVRAAVRRQCREQEAVAMNELHATPDASWQEIAPQLDAALGELTEADRDAVLLRYFERKSAAEMAEILGVTDEAAQKRVSRAVEKLREFFTKRKITIGAGSLGILISANAVQSAPVGLATTISATVLAGTAVTTSTIITATKTIAMNTLQKTLITATVAMLAGAGIYEARQAHDASIETQKFQEQQAALAAQIRQLQNSFVDATNRLAGLLAENFRLKSDNHEAELLKLRGDIGVLRNQLQQQKDLAANSTNETANAGHRRQMSQFMAKDQMRNAGFDTPEAGFQTFMAAMASTNYDDLLASLSQHADQPPDTPENRQQFQTMIAQKMESFQGMEIIAKKYRGDDQADLEVMSFTGTNAPTINFVQMKKVNDQWKYFGGSNLAPGWDQDKDVQAIIPSNGQ